MTLTRIVWNHLRQRPFSTLLTMVGVSVGVALIIAILLVKSSVQQKFQLGYTGYDLVVGAKGSGLQLALNVVYQLDASPGNIPYSWVTQLRTDRRVKDVFPFSVGDNYQGYRIVGTTDEFLKHFEATPGETLSIRSGRIFHFNESSLMDAMREAEHRVAPEVNPQKNSLPESSSDQLQHEEDVFESVLGSEAARQTGLKIGDTFVATHGLQKNVEGEKHAEQPWTVTGILNETGTPVDRAIYINLDSFYHIKGHAIEIRSETNSEEPSQGQISAIGLKAHGFTAIWSLRKELNESIDVQATSPAEEIRKLFAIVGNVDRILYFQALLIVGVASLGTAVALYHSMMGRRRDIAVMRALGARRSTIFIIIMGEAMAIAAGGALIGWLGGHLILTALSPWVHEVVQFSVSGWTFHWFEIPVVLGVLGIGALSGIAPAYAAYRTDVASRLSGNG